MSRLPFDNFFLTATGNTPYDYQSRLAGNDSGTACRSQLINVPTGLGKTAAVDARMALESCSTSKPEVAAPTRFIACPCGRSWSRQNKTCATG